MQDTRPCDSCGSVVPLKTMKKMKKSAELLCKHCSKVNEKTLPFEDVVFEFELQYNFSS